MKVVLNPLAIISWTVGPSVVSLTLLHAHDVTSLILWAIVPCLHTLTVALIVLPLAIVFCAFGSCVDTLTISLIFWPVSVIYVPIYKSEFTLTCCQIVVPGTFILGTVFPVHLTLTVTHATLPLSSVDGTGLVSVLAGDQTSLILKFSTKRFLCFLGLKVFGCLVEILDHNSILFALLETANHRLNPRNKPHIVAGNVKTVIGLDFWLPGHLVGVWCEFLFLILWRRTYGGAFTTHGYISDLKFY
jgi:hypothetical protein